MNAHAVRIGIGRPRNGHDLEDLARLRIDLLHDVIARNQHPQRAVVPIEPMRTVAFRRTDAQRAKILRIDFRHGPDAERHHPERLRLRYECDAVHAAAPDQWMDLDRLAGLEIRLNHFSVGLVSWTRRAPSADAAVGAEPHVAGADREAARVVRFGLHLVQHLAGLPVDFEDALRHLIADPQAVGRGFERVRMEIGRLEQPLDLRGPRRSRRRRGLRSQGARAAFVATALLPGAPLLYNGQEVESPQKLPLFERQTVAWGQPLSTTTRNFYQHIIMLARTNPAFSGDDIQPVTTTAGDDVISYRCRLHQRRYR